MLGIACLLLLGTQVYASSFSANYDYQGDAPVAPLYVGVQGQQVLDGFDSFAGNLSPMKMLAEDMMRGRRFKPLNGGIPIGGPMAMRGQVDVPTAVRQLNASHRTDSSWPDAGIKFGAVAGVSLDQHGNVVIFHRADRRWTETTFDLLNVFQERSLGMIKTNTILAIGRKSGELVYGFGKDLFYMPHGITVDGEDNIWVTDVALHQVMKLNRNIGGDSPLMVLGSKFVPGNGKASFCKPTSVAVLPNGDFFVADGYCNSRIIKFNKRGERILDWGKNAFQGRSFAVAPVNYFAIPHGLTLALDKGLLCVADRENGRVQCFHHSNGTFHSQYHSQLIGDRLFSVAYSPIKGGQLYVVNGPPLSSVVRMEVKGFVIDMASGNVTAKFPNDANYSNPHDIAVTNDGSEIYVVEYDPYAVHKLVSLSRPLGQEANTVHGVPSATSALRGILIVALVMVLGLLVGGSAWIVIQQRKRGNGLNTIYQPRKRSGRLAWELFPGKPDLNLGALLDGNRSTARRHRKPSTSRGKFKQLGQEEDSGEETTAMLKEEEPCGEEIV